MILVDSSVWIDHFNGHASPEAVFLAGALADGDAEAIIVPGIVLAEILSGLRTDAEARRVAELLDIFERLPELDTADYMVAAQIYRTCRRKGESIRSLADCLIAQLCLRHGCRLLSKDRDFEKIARCFPLALQRF